MNTRSILPLAAALCAVSCSTLPPKAAPVYGPTNPPPARAASSGVRYFGSVIELKPEKEKLYRELHAKVWPEVSAAIRKAKIRNFNIFVADLGGKRYLFSHFEYHGTDPDKDFAAMANDPTTRDKWWPITDACQQRVPGTPDGKQWFDMEMVCHLE